MAPADKKGKKKSAETADSGAIDDIFGAPKKKTADVKTGSKKRAAEEEGGKSKKAKVEGEVKGKSSKKEKEREESGKKEKKKAEGEGKKEKKERKEKSGKEKESKPERTVEEVVDPSVAVAAAVERAKEARAAPQAKGKRQNRKEVEEDRLWRDSRGDSDRESPSFAFDDDKLTCRKAHRRRLPRVQGGRARHRPRGWRHASLPLRLRML